jgi:glutamine synthetase
VEVFEKHNVLSRRELESRHEVFLEQYVTKLNIEAETAASIARTMLLPAAARHLALLLEAQLGELASETSDLIAELTEAIKKLESVNLAENQPEELEPHAEFMRDSVVPAMEDVRAAADKLEKVVADDLWPLPKYSEILFIK